MKILSPLVVLSAVLLLIVSSCKKERIITTKDPVRKVQFTLYTSKDFSGDNTTITFRLSIQNATGQTLWDSLLAPMKLKDIPDLAHKMVFEKIVPGNNPSRLKAGFFYSIENVGDAWHLDSFEAGETAKTIDFNFQ